MEYGGFLGLGNSIIAAFADKIKQVPNYNTLMPTLKAFSTAVDVIVLLGWILAIVALIASIVFHQGTKMIYKGDAKKIEDSKQWSKTCWISAIILFAIPAILAIALTIFASAIG